MPEVMYCELGTEELRAVPKEWLLPITNYEQVERIRSWPSPSTSFKLIDIGGNKNFMAMPLSQKLESTNIHLATLHWGDNVPPDLKGDLWFWVGPIDTYVWRDKPKPRYFNRAKKPGPSNRFQQFVAPNATLQSTLTSPLPPIDISVPPLQFRSSTLLQQCINDVMVTPPQSGSSTAPLQFEPPTLFPQAGPSMLSPIFEPLTGVRQAGSSPVPALCEPLTAFRKPGPLMPAFEYKPSIAHKQSDSSRARRNFGSSTVHTKPRLSSAEKDRGPPTTPVNPSSSKAHKQSGPRTFRRESGSSTVCIEPGSSSAEKEYGPPAPSGPRTAPLHNDVSKALKQTRSQRYIPQSEPLNVFRQANQRDPLMPPFELEASFAPKQSGPLTPFQLPGLSTRYRKAEISKAEEQNWGPATAAPGKISGSSSFYNLSGPRTARPKQHDSSTTHHQPGSWRRRLSQSGLLSATGQAGSSSARHPEGRAQSGLSTPPAEEEENCRDWWSDDGHDTRDKGRGLK